jgi:hypothetical protein
VPRDLTVHHSDNRESRHPRTATTLGTTRRTPRYVKCPSTEPRSLCDRRDITSDSTTLVNASGRRAGLVRVSSVQSSSVQNIAGGRRSPILPVPQDKHAVQSLLVCTPARDTKRSGR